jgi:hypothetical protein
MTPYEITILIWYYTRPVDWEDMSAPIWRETVRRFLELGLLEDSDKYGVVYVGTEKLKAYIEQLCQTPLPELKWVYEVQK